MTRYSDGTDTLHSARVGDEVVYTLLGSDAVVVSKVSRVEHPKVVLEDGSEWRVRGGLRWGSSRSHLSTARQYARLVVDRGAFDAHRRTDV